MCVWYFCRKYHARIKTQHIKQHIKHIKNILKHIKKNLECFKRIFSLIFSMNKTLENCYYLDDGRPSGQMHGTDVQW